MLLHFRLHQRHPTGLAGLGRFSMEMYSLCRAVLHLRDYESDFFRAYDVEILPDPVAATAPSENEKVTTSPMNVEFAVFVKTTTVAKRVSFYWFSVAGIWNFIHKENRTNTINVDDRMAGHFLRFETLIAQSYMDKKNSKLSSWKARRESTWPIEMDTIFVSGIGLWHFIFAAADIKPATFIEQLLLKHIYPLAERMTAHHAIGFIEDGYNPKIGDTSTNSPCWAWLTSHLRRLCHCFNASPGCSNKIPQIVENCKQLNDQLDCLKRQIRVLQQRQPDPDSITKTLLLETTV